MAEPLDEFQRIARFFAPLAAPGALGLADDAALIDGPAGEHYVLTADAIVEGVHFRRADPARLVAQKLLRVNLSDLAAKGASPLGYLLTMALPPHHDEAWLAEFAAGLAADQKQFGIALLGGDSVATSGPATLSLTAIGRIGKGRAVLRSGAKPGDRLFVSGTLGDAALGLAALEGMEGDLRGIDEESRAYLADRYHLPQPRLALGQGLLGMAHAMIDISDGLVADLGHICAASKVAGVIEARRLPLSRAARIALAADADRIAAPLSGGDDYELLFAVPEAASSDVTAIARHLNLPITMIGYIEAGSGVTVLDQRGAPMKLTKAGYRHF